MGGWRGQTGSDERAFYEINDYLPQFQNPSCCLCTV